jgi:hypothetical protein
MRDLARWETEEGIAFLKRVGEREGDRVVDFGACVLTDGSSTSNWIQRGGIPLAAMSLHAACTASQPMFPTAPTMGSTWEARISPPTFVRATSSPKAAPRSTSESVVSVDGNTHRFSTSNENLDITTLFRSPAVLHRSIESRAEYEKVLAVWQGEHYLGNRT